jgi:hypothetical protein
MFRNSTTLIDAYNATDYVAIFAKRETVIRVGQHNPEVERLLAFFGVRGASFVTAWNPFSKNVGRIANATADRRLCAWVRRRGLRWIEGFGRGTIGNWPPEKSALVFGLSDAIRRPWSRVPPERRRVR